MTTQFDAVDAFEKLTSSEKELVGLYQEARLSQDEEGGEDGMWFDEAVSKVTEDCNAAIKWVVNNWPHGFVSVSAVKNHCGF